MDELGLKGYKGVNGKRGPHGLKGIMGQKGNESEQGQEGEMFHNSWKQCVWENINDYKDLGIIKVWDTVR